MVKTPEAEGALMYLVEFSATVDGIPGCLCGIITDDLGILDTYTDIHDLQITPIPTEA